MLTDQQKLSPTYVASLDGIRALSIIFVIIAHTVPAGPKSWVMNAMFGKLGMALFFCLSGYLITSILYAKPQALPFLVKRIFRIVPAAYLYLTILVLFFDMPMQSYITNLLFMGNYFTTALEAGAVSHFWSLCVEIHFYLVVGFGVMLAGRNFLWLVPVAAVAVTLLRVQYGVYANINTHFRVDEILSGGCLALFAMHYGARVRHLLRSAMLSYALIIVAAVLLVASAHEWGGALNYLRPYLAAIFVGIVMHSNAPALLRQLEGRVAGYIAKISYALYIYHPLMILGWMNEGGTLVKYLAKRPVSWALTLAAAHLSTYYWELYWQKMAGKWAAALSKS